MASKTILDVVNIMKKVVGEQDSGNPDATSDQLLEYASDFYQIIMGQEIKTHDLFSNLEFSTVIGQDDYTFSDRGFTNIYQPAYLIDSNNDDIRLNWYQDEQQFFLSHPVDPANEENAKPFDLLYMGDIIKLRPTPDAVYTIRIRAYKELKVINEDSSQVLEHDYYLRYIAYGASLDYLADHGNFEDYENVYKVYSRYRSLVMNRTASQLTTQRISPAL